VITADKYFENLVESIELAGTLYQATWIVDIAYAMEELEASDESAELIHERLLRTIIRDRLIEGYGWAKGDGLDVAASSITRRLMRWVRMNPRESW